MKAIKIGKVVEKILSEKIPELSGKIFPVVVNQKDQNLPLVVYKRDSIIPLDTKDRYICQESVLVRFDIYTSTYQEGLGLAEKVIDTLYHYKGEVLGITVVDSLPSDIEEDWADDVFSQTIIYKFLIS